MGCGSSKNGQVSDPEANGAQDPEALAAQIRAADEARAEAAKKAGDDEATKQANDEMLQRERREKDEKRLTCAIVGPPGSIKGKLCELIVNEHGMKHVSGGEALRDAIKSGTEAGLRAQEARKDTGQVPEKLQTEIVGALLMSDALLDCGWLLDGLPRSRAQADALKAVGARLRRLIVVEVDDDELVRRATGRRIDPVTHTLYHDAGIGFPCPPEDEEVRARLTQRRDDTEERVRQRLEQFRVGNEVEAVAAEFEQVLRVDGSLDPAALMPLVSRFFAAPGPGDASAGTPPT